MKRRLGPSDKQYRQAYATVLNAAFAVPPSPDWGADLLAQLDAAKLQEPPERPMKSIASSPQWGAANPLIPTTPAIAPPHQS
jgi:hypothetical protein